MLQCVNVLYEGTWGSSTANRRKHLTEWQDTLDAGIRTAQVATSSRSRPCMLHDDYEVHNYGVTRTSRSAVVRQDAELVYLLRIPSSVVLCQQCRVFDLELPGLWKLRRLCISNFVAQKLAVAPECKITIKQWNDGDWAGMCNAAHLAIHSATWHQHNVM